jgi:hypothetical protein
MNQFLLVINGHAWGTFPTQLQAIVEAFRLGVTQYDVHPVMVVDLSGGF